MERKYNRKEIMVNQNKSFEKKMKNLDISKIQPVNQQFQLIDLQTTECTKNGQKFSFLNCQSVNFQK